MSFSLDLSDAVEAASRERLGEFANAGIDLVHAAERESFVRLVNDQSLAHAYERGSGTVHVLDEFERTVVTTLVPDADARISARVRARAAARRLYRAARSRRVAPPRSAKREIWLAAHHPKFVRFAAPVIDRLGPDRVGVLALSDEVAVEARGYGLAVAPYVDGPRRDARGFARPHLADMLVSIEATLGAAGGRAVMTCEGNSPSDEIARLAASSAGIASVCLQHGWAAETNVGFRNLTYTAFAVWGQGFAELLGAFNPRQRFVVTGDPALDPLAEVRRPKTGGVLFALQTVAPAISSRTMRTFVELIADAAAAYPARQMIVREHPAHPLVQHGLAIPALANVSIASPGEVTLADALAPAAVVASISSTTLLEGAAAERPALVFSGDGPAYVPDLESLGVGLELRERKAAVEALGALLDATPERERALASFREHYFAGLRGDAAERVAALLDDLC